MTSIHVLPNEVWNLILGRIEADRYVPEHVDRRNHLSVESFGVPSSPLPSQATDIGNFRRTCRHFSELGACTQFTRVSLRFTSSGFQRLDNIASTTRLAKHTKKFSYLVPPFYDSGKPFGPYSENPFTYEMIRHPACWRSEASFG